MAVRQPLPPPASDQDQAPRPASDGPREPAAPAGPSNSSTAPAITTGDPYRARRPGERPAARARPSFQLALAMAAPLMAAAVVARLPLLIDPFLRSTTFPLAAVLLVAIEAGGFAIARDMELTAWQRVWLANLAVCAVLLPLLALQTATSREPYVSVELGSAGPLIWATIAVGVVLLTLAVLSAVAAVEAPEDAALLFLPAALLVPAILGAPGNLDERSTLAAAGEAYTVGSVATILAWLLPRGTRLLVGPLALGAQFVCLWLLGYGPSFHPTRGAVVPVLASALIALTVVATVLIPLLAVWVRRVRREARDDDHRPSWRDIP